MTNLQTIRVFVSSPGDVGQERILAARVLERLQGDFAGFARIEPILWEHEPLRATGHFQEQIVTPSSTDIVVCILWSRLGTRLPPDKFARPDGTPYASGTEWEFEDAALAYLSKGTPDLLVYRRVAPPQINFHDEDAAQRLAQKKALDAFIDRWFGNAHEGFRAAFTPFETPAEFEEILERHLQKLVKERLPERLAAEEGEAAITWYRGSPYRGLEAFEYEHAPVFFGRTQAIGAIKEALVAQANRGCAFVLVFGRSGGGKSSLVKAGVLPTITQPGVIDGVGLWRWCIFRPSDATATSTGDDLFSALTAALTTGSNALPELHDQAVALAELLRSDPLAAAAEVARGLDDAAAKVATEERLATPPASRLALMIDQMEEIWTRDTIGDADRAQFVAALSALARSGRVWVLATMRSDFYPRCADIPELVRLKEGAGSYDVLPPTPAEVGQMIRFPTRAAGLRFERNPKTDESLDGTLLNAAASAENALPLLSFTLDELFRERDQANRLLTFDAYRALGGLEGALARRAEEVFSALPPAAQGTLPSVLRALVTVSDEDEDLVTSRRVPLSEAANTREKRLLVDAFVAARLLVTDRAEARNAEPVVRVAHEALISHWPRLQAWLAEDHDFLRIRSRVADGAIQWRQEDRRSDFLLSSGKPLAEALDILARRRADIAPEIVDYIEASQARASRAQRVRTTALAAIGAAFFLTVSGFSVFSYGEARRAEQAATRARQEANVAQEQTRRAQEQERIASEQRGRAESASEHARLSQQRAEEQRAAAEKQKTIAQKQTALAEEQRRRAESERRIAQAQRALAQAQKAAAEKNYGHAIAAADTMVGELAEGIKPIAGTRSATVERILLTAGGVYDRLLAEGETPAVLAGKARMLTSFVDIYLRLNQSDKAVASAREAESLLERLLRQDPKNARYRADLAQARILLGRALNRQGRFAGSRAAYAEALPLWRTLLKSSSDGNDTAYRAALSETLVGIANACMVQDEQAAATPLFAEALRIRGDLAARAPSDRARLRDLGNSQLLVGDERWEAGDKAGALSAYNRALATLERAAQSSSRGSGGDDGGADDAELQHRLSEVHDSIGQTCQAQGDAAGARQHFAQAARIAERFTTLDPNDAEWLSLLLRARREEADVSEGGDQKQELKKLIDLINGLLPRMERLARNDTRNFRALQGLFSVYNARATAHIRLAQLGEAPTDNYAAAETDCRRLDTLTARIAAADPTCPRFDLVRAVPAMLRAEWHLARGEQKEALRYQRDGIRTHLGVYERLAKRYPRDPKRLESAASDHITLSFLSGLLADAGEKPGVNRADSLQHLTVGVAEYERVVRLAPNDQALQIELTKNRVSLAQARMESAGSTMPLSAAARREYVRAEAELRRAYREYESRNRAEPQNPTYVDGMRQVTYALFTALQAQGRTAEATQIFQQNQALTNQLTRMKASAAAAVSAEDAGDQVSRTTTASRAVNSELMIPILKNKLPLAATIYLSQPSTLNYQETVNTARDLAAQLMRTPTDANIRTAREALTLTIQLYHKVIEAKKLTDADQIREQEKLADTLNDALQKLPTPASPSAPPSASP